MSMVKNFEIAHVVKRLSVVVVPPWQYRNKGHFMFILRDVSFSFYGTFIIVLDVHIVIINIITIIVVVVDVAIIIQ